MIEYVIVGDIGSLNIPGIVKSTRSDNLWLQTCFECFAMTDEGMYGEFNFSPSTCWAAYSFSSYREHMTPALGKIPVIQIHETEARFALTAKLELAAFLPFPPKCLGLSAVIEEKDGTKSYWALAHPPGKPDFHHRDCFALELAPPANA